jgi:hypothetical protein
VAQDIGNNFQRRRLAKPYLEKPQRIVDAIDKVIARIKNDEYAA